MTFCTKNSVWLNYGFDISFQIVFIFAFLTLFFFCYVVTVEKAEYITQINYLIDNLLNDDNLNSLIPSDNKINKKDIDIILSGIIGSQIEEININSKDENNDILINNKKIKNKALKLLLIVFLILIILIIISYLFRYCIPIISKIKESLWIILFIGMAELLFLIIIAKNYMTVDPNYIKNLIATQLINYYNNKQTIPTPTPI